MDEKMTISYEHSPAFRGYMPLGVENTEGKTDRRDQIEYAAEFRSSNSALQNQLKNDEEDTQFYHRLRATNQWPDSIHPSLSPAINEYASCVLTVAERLLDAMCLALDVNPVEVQKQFGQYDDADDPSFWSGKLVSYPHNNAESSMIEQGVGTHTDSNFLTLICQDPFSSGLQVQNVQGGWLNVPPTSSNLLICNIGELAEVWTGGYFLATPHRVLRHSSGSRGRISLPIFYNPKLDTVMKPINNLSLPWTRIKQNQWRNENNSMINSVGENSFKSLARSHPKVFGRHHSDLRILKDGRIVKKNEGS